MPLFMSTNVNIDHVSPVHARLKISVGSEVVTRMMNDYFNEIAKSAKIQGFRQGKAPLSVIKQFYKASGNSQIGERLVSRGLYEAIQKHELNPVVPPLLMGIDDPIEGKDFIFEAELALKPKVKAPDCSQINVESVEAETVEDEQIQKEIDVLLDREASFVDIKEPRPVKTDDVVIVDFNGKLDGEEVSGASAENQNFQLGQNQLLAEFEDAIVGMNVDEKKEFDVPFPENYQAQELQGKTVRFSLTLKSIKEKERPPLDDEFAQSINPDFKTLADLKEDLRKKLQDQKAFQAKKELREKIQDELLKLSDFEINQKQIEVIAERILEQTKQTMMNMGIPATNFESEEALKSLREDSLTRAERQIRLAYILEAIAHEQKLEVSEDDLDNRLQETAKATGLSIEQVKGYYNAKEDGSSLSKMEQLKIDVLDEKSLDYAISKATIKSKGV